LNRALAEAVVGCLRVSGATTDNLDRVARFRQRDWDRTLKWLEYSGLTFYFLQSLQDHLATGILPAAILSRFEGAFTHNQQRNTHMAAEFDRVNQILTESGAQYAVIKGFSLVPQFCPDASLRRQSDFDYLVSRQSLGVAQRALEQHGYSLSEFSNHELILVKPSAASPQAGHDRHLPRWYVVELHTEVWEDDLYQIPIAEPSYLENRNSGHWNGLVFPTLPEEDAFLVQMLHAFKHILGCWVKMSWLLEIAYFLTRRAPDAAFWQKIEQRCALEPLLSEITVVVTKLAAQLFSCPIPSAIGAWAEGLRPEKRVWIEKYGRHWAFGEYPVYDPAWFSPAKLALFLHQLYVADPKIRKSLTQRRLFPRKRYLRSMNPNGQLLPTTWKRRDWLARQFIFHVGSGLRYLWEIPRWRRLNKVAWEYFECPPHKQQEA
jgi:hypothetical protein